MFKKIVYFALIALVSGCADSTRINPDASYSDFNLHKVSVVYVSVPDDGRYGNKIYEGSGKNVSGIIKSSLLVHVADVTEGKDVEEYNEAILSAKKSGADYLVHPTILHWEDRATEWSMIPDKVSVKILVYHMLSSSIVSATTIDGTSGLATFGGDHPQDLLPEPIKEYIDGITK